MTENLKYTNVYSALIAAVPELHPLVVAELSKYYDLANEAPAEYPVFEDVVKPFLRKCLENTADRQLAIRLFQFLERMATSDDPGVVTLLRIGILESLAYDPVFYVAAHGYMGPKTAEYVELDRRDYERRGILPA
jgi:hypothetical protein